MGVNLTCKTFEFSKQERKGGVVATTFLKGNNREHDWIGFDDLSPYLCLGGMRNLLLGTHLPMRWEVERGCFHSCTTTTHPLVGSTHRIMTSVYLEMELMVVTILFDQHTQV